MSRQLKLIIPKGRLQENVLALLARAGVELTFSHRSYRPACSDSELSVKLVKSQNVPSLIALDRHDAGFTGLDWVTEHTLAMQGQTTPAEVHELLDLGSNPVRIVVAVPEALAGGDYRNRPLVVASEYTELSKQYIAQKGLNAYFLKTYGATEALPPEDADMIIDNTATGATLVQNRLTIIDDVLRSTTRFVANSLSLQDDWKREKLETLVLLMQSAMNADQRMLVEMNVDANVLDAVVAMLPAMKAPTVTPLFHKEGHLEAGFAVKAAVPNKQLPGLILKLKQAGARDILAYRLEKLVP
jgi:ATP phosphoribosyltransferase